MTLRGALPLAAALASLAGAAHAQTSAPADTAAPATPSRWATPFAVESTGSATPHRVRGEVVWVRPERAARDTAQPAELTEEPSEPADSAAPPPRRATARDSAARPPRTPGRATPRDSTARSPRAAARDTAATPPRRTTRADSATRRDTAAARPAAGTRPRTHTVAAGETLSAIARRYGVTTAQLRALNPADTADGLETGAVLRLPPAPRTPAATPARRDTSAAPRTPARRDTASSTPAPRRRTHTVVAGETLYALSRRYGVSPEAIRRANGMTETAPLRTGQTVVIPAP